MVSYPSLWVCAALARLMGKRVGLLGAQVEPAQEGFFALVSELYYKLCHDGLRAGRRPVVDEAGGGGEPGDEGLSWNLKDKGIVYNEGAEGIEEKKNARQDRAWFLLWRFLVLPGCALVLAHEALMP